MHNIANLWPKRYPTYGRQLEKIRQAGKILAMGVIVSTRWQLDAAHSRYVIPDNIPVANVNFRYLAGLSVQNVRCNNKPQLVIELIDAIAEIKPSVLVEFYFKLAQSQIITSISSYRLIHFESMEVLDAA